MTDRTAQFTDLIDLASERARRLGALGERRVLRAEGSADQARRRLSGAKACTRSAGSGWTVGKLGAAANAGLRLVHRPARHPGRHRGRRRRHELIIAATIRSRARSKARASRACRDPETIATECGMDRDPSALAARGRRQERVRGAERDAVHAPAPQHLSRWRRGAAPRARRRVLRLRSRHHAGSEVDLAAAENGGQVLLCSDMFFGIRHNLIMPGRSTHMGDGWETRRRRGPGHDLVDREARDAGTIAADRDRHGSLQGERAGAVHGRDLRCALDA